MKKLIIILAVVTISLSGCLKDKPNVDFSKIFPTINLPYSGLAYFGADAVTDATDTITKNFTINLASDYPLSTDTKVTVGVDTSLIASYIASNSAVLYNSMPAAAYTFPQTTVTIKAGTRLATLSVTFIKHFLDPSKSYMLPIRILSAGQVISANFSTHYYHFIGNDFAGTYEHFYTRWNTPDTLSSSPSSNHLDLGPAIFNPVSPTEFTVKTNYYTQPRYDVTFTKTGSGASAMYSNFVIKFLPADIAAGSQWATAITVVNSPVFLPADYKTNPFDPSKSYTYAQSLKLFRFYFTTASRSIMDQFVKP
jgi:hypothetical protein